MTTRCVGVVLVLAALSSCTTSEPRVEIASSPLAGTVGGMPWTFRAGATNAFLSEGDPNFFAAFYATAYNPCVDFEPRGPHLLAAVPKQPGDYGFDLSRNMTFAPGDNVNLVSFDGHIVVDAVTATTVTGGLHGFFDGDNEVNGRFEIAVCPDE